MLTTGSAHFDNRRPANQPKPNTRFLNNIIRDTNSHNRALLAKENAESQARLTGGVDLVLGQGSRGMVPTTVLDLTTDFPELIRQGKGDWPV